jgi:hypothetical protein
MSLRTTAFQAALVSLLLVGGIFHARAAASVIRHDVADAAYQSLGSDPDYDSVGRITYGSNSGSGSGVLVGQNWYLTAAHNVYASYLANTPGDVQFTVGSNTYLADEIFVHPGYVSGSSTNGNDLALVRISANVSNVTPADIYTGGGEIGQVGTFVGFGRTGTGLTGSTVSTSVKRGGTNVLDVTANTFAPTWSSNLTLSDFDNPNSAAYSTWGSTTPTALEMQVAVGDSGGGVFVDFGSGPVLSGISTFVLLNGDSIENGYGDGMAATRLSGHAEWIAQTMLVPEPTSLKIASLGLCAVGAECLRRYRKRKQR